MRRPFGMQPSKTAKNVLGWIRYQILNEILYCSIAYFPKVSRENATRELPMSVGWSVCWSVGNFFEMLAVFCYTAPAHPSAKGGESIQPC